jgi:amino acid transporter
MYCAKRGKKLASDAKLCLECGGEVVGGGGQPQRSYRRQIIFLGALMFILSTVVFFLISSNVIGKNSEKVAGAMAMADIVVFIVFFVYVIKASGARSRERRPNFRASLILLAILVITLISFLVYSHFKTEDKSLLAESSMYNGSIPDPIVLDFPDESGQTISAWAYPGQITVFVPEDTEVSEVKKVFSPHRNSIAMVTGCRRKTAKI